MQALAEIVVAVLLLGSGVVVLVAALGLVLFLLFDKLLDVVLPSGLLSFVLGGR